jgi:uncharacterized protein (DUF885 family)
MRILQFLLIVSVMLSFISCSRVGKEDKKFEKLADQYIQTLLEMNPEWATDLGDHRYDSLMNDYSMLNVRKESEMYHSYLVSLDQIDPSRLSATNRIDYEILMNAIDYSIFELDTLKPYQWNPRRYNPGGAIYSLLARDFAPLKDRLQSVKGRLAAIPSMLENAKANLKTPPKIYTETAILQINGTIGLIRDDLNTYLEDEPEMIPEIKPLQDQAVAALQNYATWLQDVLLPRSTGDFRLGKEKYRVKFRYVTQTDFSMEQILKRAEDELAMTHNDIYETAIPLFKQYFPDQTDSSLLADRKKVVRMVLDKMAEDHPTAENIVDNARAKLRECEEFVRTRKLVSLPDKPIEIIVMPEFARGFAVAYCSSPGPLEEKGQTFYSIAPPPADWDSERVDSYFREYNNYMLWDLTVHEAMPGHYLHAAHNNEFKAPTMVRNIYGSGTFTEGWATYCEQLMVDQGFDGPEAKMQMLKMRLRMIINAIIDQKIHTAGMTEDEAMAMMIEEGFQEEGEAAGKWRRACLSSVQLSTYYVGNIEINDLRRAYQNKMGEDFDMLEFHDKLLSFGTPPPKYARQLMDLI